MCCRIHEAFCGYTLRQGAIATTVVTGIIALICVILGAVTLIGASAVKQSTINPDPVQPDDVQLDEKTVDIAVTIINVTGGFFMTLGLLAVIGCGCLIGAVVKNSPGLVIPWLIIAMIHIVIDCLFGILSLVVLSYAGVLWLVPGGLLIYVWVVCYSYKSELEVGPPPYYPATTIKA